MDIWIKITKGVFLIELLNYVTEGAVVKETAPLNMCGHYLKLISVPPKRDKYNKIGPYLNHQILNWSNLHVF